MGGTRDGTIQVGKVVSGKFFSGIFFGVYGGVVSILLSFLFETSIYL